MFIKQSLMALAAACLLLPATAHAFPESPAELQQIIDSEFGGNPSLYVADEEGDFRRFGCRGRSDLMQALLDAGYSLQQTEPEVRIRMFVCAIYEERSEFLQAFLTPDWLAEVEQKYVGSGAISPLQYAVSENDFALTQVLLANESSYFHLGGRRGENLTRDGQLLLGASRARRSNKDRSLAAFAEALPDPLMAASRNEQFVELVDDTSRNRAGNGSSDGGGGGLLGGLGDLALGAALGGSRTDFLLAAAGTSILEGDGGEVAEQPSKGEQSADSQRLLARYVATIPYAPDETRPRAQLGLMLRAEKLPRPGMQVVEILPGEAGARAGLATGDFLTKIAGTRVYSAATLHDGLYAAADGGAFEVEFLRNGELRTVSTQSQLAPLASTDPASKGETITAEPVETIQVNQTRDTLEELERLADLRDRGVLSEEEFEELKERVLAAP